METDAQRKAEELERSLQWLGDPARAEHERRYLKSDLTHYGCSVPAIRGTARSFEREPGRLARDDLVELVEALWARPVHECRMLAVVLLERRQAVLLADDVELVERLLRESRTWALVDGLAVKVAGPLLDRHPDPTVVLDRWAADDDFWLRRSALLAHLLDLRAGGGDFERFARYADAMLDEREFFVAKAIGWVLRETGRRRPAMVAEWLRPRAHRAGTVTVREAVKPLSPSDSQAVLDASRTRTPIDG